MNVESVLALLGEQAALYDRLESLAARQRGLVSGESVGPLLEVLADRQRLSEQLARVGSRLAPIRREWPSYRGRLSPSQRVEADRLWDEARDRLRRVIEGDERDVRVLSGRKHAGATALSAVQSSGSALSAYRTPYAAAQRLDGVNEVDGMA